MNAETAFVATAEDEARAQAYWGRIQPIGGDASYKGDFAAWAFDQARRLRALKSNDLDIDNLAEEIESLGKGEVNKLESFVRLILLHMLKWDYQSRLRGASWETSVRKSRRHLARHLRENPSLQPILAEAIADAYQDARDEAAEETGFPEKYFPATNPYSFDVMMNRELARQDPEL